MGLNVPTTVGAKEIASREKKMELWWKQGSDAYFNED